MNPFHTRSLEAADLPAAAQVLEAAILASPLYNEWSKRGEIASLGATALTMKLESGDFAVTAAFEGDTMIGVIVFSFEAGLAWLDWIAVAADHRGRGVAHVLMRAFEGSAVERGAHKIWCDSRVENTASQKLLESHGYSVAMTLKRHWYGLDFFIWEKFLEIAPNSLETN
jgi:ribosomal protein S18 acetylase RimI-like enzyme